MIKSIHLRNFQRHKRLDIDLDKVVCITGKNDAGKSSVLRAVRWLCTNRPAGDSFRRRGSKRTKVTLVVDSKRISRTKGSGRNDYSIDGRRLKKGMDRAAVPEPVAALLSVGEGNFQRHHAAPFWFGLTPGLVAKELNRIVNLDRIDSSLAWIATKVRRSKAAVDVSRERLGVARERLGGLAGVPRLAEDWRALLERYTALQVFRDKRARIIAIGEDVGRVAREADVASEREKWLSAAVSLAESARATASRLARLRENLSQTTRLAESISRHDQEAGRLHADLERRSGDRCPVCGARSKPK